jgi:hypothetical protein
MLMMFSRIQTPANYKIHDAFPAARIVTVIFTDPTEFDTRFDNSENPIECLTVGWLTEQTKKNVKLAWLYDTEDETGSTGLILPRGCIKRITPVYRRKSRKSW